MGLEALKTSPRDPMLRASIATWYAKSGSPAKARKMIASALAINPEDVQVRYMGAVSAAWDHESDEAFKQLEAALVAGSRADNARNDPDMAPLRADPRFSALLSKYAKPKKPR